MQSIKSHPISISSLESTPTSTPTKTYFHSSGILSSIDNYFDKNILIIIANFTDEDTKRTLKEVCKFYKDFIEIEPTFGRQNGDYLLQYIKMDCSYTCIYLLNSPDTSNREYIKIQIYRDYNTNKIVFIRHRYNEVDDVIGLYKYKNASDLKNIKLSDIIKKQKQSYVSRFLHNLTGVDMQFGYLLNHKYFDVIQKWQLYVCLNK